MPPTDCPVCYNLSFTKAHRRLSEIYPTGQLFHHWMFAREIRSSAIGMGEASNYGDPVTFSQPCETCAVLRDAVESFLRQSNLTKPGLDVSLMEYTIALQDTGWVQQDESGNYRDSDDELGATRLRILMRCNVDSPKTEDGEAKKEIEEFEVEVYTQKEGFRRIGAAPEVKWAISVQDCAETIKPWLKECLEQHSSCKTASATHTPKPLPKRVLDVADQKVVLTEPGSKKGLYVALSHSWGKAEVLTTTIQTLADRKQKILTKALPRSFHEAVMITRALGLRYLWIDSLCIIQDDPKDWAEQVATMGEVYGNCFLNIAATRSSRPLDGFISPHYVFSDTLAWSQEGQPLPGNDAASKPVSKNRIMAFESYPVSIQEESNPYHGKLRVRLALNSPHDSVLTTCWNPAFKAEAPLFSRAWAYQERCLAPRTVHFHANELVWECASKSHCECQALDEMCIPEGYNAAKSFILTRQPRSISPMSPGILGKGKLDIGAFWRVIVEDYTPLHLTYESDRLPAIGGLASKIHGFFHLSGNDYLAGLWRHTLARDLLWEVSGSSTVPRRGQLGDKTPPSWSWASLTWGDDKPGIKWEYESKPKALMHGVFTTYKQDKRFSIVKATSSPTSSWPYGHVSGGSITVTGAMCAIAVSDNTAPIPQIWRDQIPVKSKDILNSLHLRYDDPCDEDEVTHPDNPVRGLIFCIFVGTFYSHFELDREGEHPNRKGLILKPSKTVPGAAERIGVWDQYIEEWTVGKAVFSMEATTVTVTIV